MVQSQHNMRTLSPDEFPSRLRHINDPPKKLYLEGTLPDEEQYAYLAVVGSRAHSSYAKDACNSLLAGLAGYPVAIVSGLALGIDALAHRAALAANLPTIAVPGSGLAESVLYPAFNRRLAREIVSSGGALISEFEPMFRATTYSFPQRNRIMAGMCQAILVVEASEKSGTLITARLALDYNRDVFVVPGSIFSSTARGSNSLIRKGAAPITSSAELLEELGFSPKEQKILDLADATAEERRILEILRESMPRDAVFERAGLSAAEGAPILMMMELKGFIQESGGEIHNLTSL